MIRRGSMHSAEPPAQFAEHRPPRNLDELDETGEFNWDMHKKNGPAMDLWEWRFLEGVRRSWAYFSSTYVLMDEESLARMQFFAIVCSKYITCSAEDPSPRRKRVSEKGIFTTGCKRWEDSRKADSLELQVQVRMQVGTTTNSNSGWWPYHQWSSSSYLVHLWLSGLSSMRKTDLSQKGSRGISMFYRRYARRWSLGAPEKKDKSPWYPISSISRCSGCQKSTSVSSTRASVRKWRLTEVDRQPRW